MKSQKWYHGTNSEKFSDWIIPPPARGNDCVSHSGVFFARNRAVAKSYGPNICSASLVNASSIFDVDAKKIELEKLRLELLKSEMGSMCVYTKSRAMWETAWSQSLILGFYISDCAILNGQLYGKECDPKDAINKQRIWVEDVCLVLKEMGYDGLFSELRKTFGGKTKLEPYKVFVAFNQSALQPPKWL